MAKNKKKKKEVEKQYGNGIAPISLNSNFNINTPTVETKKTTKKAKKETKKKKKEKETIKVSDLVKSVDPDTPIAQKYNTEEYNQYYNSLSNKQKAKENEKVAKQISKQKNTELNKSRTKANKELMPVLAQTLDEQFKRQNQLTFNPTAEDKTNLTENYGVTSEKSPYSKNYKKTEKEKASANVMSKYGIEAKENDVILADYLKNYYEQDNQEPTIAEKILSPVTQAGTLVTGIAKPLGYQQYQRKDGLKTYLPDKLDLNYEKTGEKIDSGLGKFIYEAGGEASKILASSGINAIAPGAGTGMYWASMTGNNITQARNKATEKGEEATGKVLLNAAAKTGLEYVTGKFLGSATKGLTGGKASELEKAITDKVYDAKFLQSLSDSTKLKIAKLVGTGVSEGTEETIQDPIEKLIDILTFGDDGKHKNVKELVTDLETYKDALKAGAAGALTAGMVEGANMVTNSSYYDQGAAEIEKNKRTKNEQKVIDAELQNRIATEFNGEATAKEIAQLQKEIIEDMEKGYVSTDTIEQTLGGKTYKELEKINQKKNNIQQEINELQKKADNNELSSLEEKQKLNDLKEEIKTIDDSEVRKKLNQEIQETIKNDISLQESYKETGRRKENYSVDLSKVEDEKQRAVYQKAMDSGVLNNSNKTHALVDMIAKISSDKNIDFDFTNNERLEQSGFGLQGDVFEVRDSKGKLVQEFRTETEAKKYINKLKNPDSYNINNVYKAVNGYLTKNGITINLNSQRAINRIVGHEITHTFEGTKLHEDLKNSLKKFAGESRWNELVEEYKYKYKDVEDSNPENELISDLVGDYLFTDENYVRDLSTKHKTTFDKVYDQIKYLYNVATAGSKEQRQLAKVKKTFDKMYNELKSKTTREAKMSVEKKDLSKDNQGNKVNKNMQEYMKDSYARENQDINAPLVKVYHGTNTPGFTVFNPSQGNSVFGTYKFGDKTVVYLTASKESAAGYTEIGVEEKTGDRSNIYEGYVNITNPYIVENSSKAEVKSWRNIKDDNVREYQTHYYEQFENNWNTDKSLEANIDEINEDLYPFNCEIRYNDGYYELYDLGSNNGFGEDLLFYVDENADTSELFDEGLKDFIYGESYDDYHYTTDKLVKWILTENEKAGKKYDGIIIPDIMDTGARGSIGGEPTTDYVIFNSNQFKETTNTHPTVDSDIRYSITVQEANTTQDNKGRKLSKEVIEYNKNSVAVDNDGNLITVYHTTTEPIIQFNEFNPVGTPGYRFGDQEVNFFTNSKTMSGSYADYQYEMAQTKRFNNIQEAVKFVENITGEHAEFRKEKSEYDGREYYAITDEYGEDYVSAWSEEELLKNVAADLQKNYGEKANIQYEGYVNITNPYIVEGNEANWDNIITGYDEIAIRYANEISQEDKQALIDLYEESKYNYEHRFDRLKELHEQIDKIQEEHAGTKLYKLKNWIDNAKNDKEIRQILNFWGLTRKEYKQWVELDNLLEEERKKAVSEFDNPRYEDSYFRENVEELLNKINNEQNMGYNEHDLFEMAKADFNEEKIREIFAKKETTNDIVKKVIQMNKKGANYDGVIIKNVIDYGSTIEFDDNGAAQDVYVTFNSNQFKAVDNTNPTEDADIRYSLSGDAILVENNEDISNLEMPKSPYQTLRPNVRGGWTIEKIQKQLKNESSNRVNSKELSKFDSLDDLMNNIYYHGSISAHDNLKAGSTLQENQRTGGYGEEYHSISLSGNKNIASNFASMGQNGTVMPVILKKDANVIEMPNVEDSIELEDILPELWDKGVDAVKIGDWDIETKGYGEQELVVLNPRAIMTMPQGTTYFQNYHKPKFQNMTKEEVLEALTKAKEKALSDPKLKPELAQQVESRYDKLIKYSKNNEDIRYSISKDSQGRELSEEQQEYFRDNAPETFDKNGNIEVMYHTTPNKFTIFDKSKLGDNTAYDNTAFGFFVTPNKDFSNRFGDIDNQGNKSNVMELYAHITKPITHPYNADYMYSGEELDNIVRDYFNAIDETEGLNELESYVRDGDFENLYQAYMNTVVTDLGTPFEYAEEERNILEKKGYDSVRFIEGDERGTISEDRGTEPVVSFAVFNSNQLKNVNNLNPTENDDIRYSLDTNQKLSDLDNEIIRDNRGEYKGFYNWVKSITKNNNELQNELLFKHYSQNFEIPIKDNETRFYHGTDATYDYNSLKTMDFDEQTMDRNYGDYFYITPDKSFANIYGREIAEFIVPDDKILSLDEYRNEINNGKTEDELFNKYWAIEMPDGEYIVKDTTPLIDYSKQKAQEYIDKREQENTKYSLDIAPISKNFLTEAEQDELDGLRAVENSGFSELTPEEQSRMYELENRANTILNKKAEKMLRSASYKAINTTTKIAQNYLDFDANQKKEFRSQMREFSNMTRDELVNADTYNKVKDIVSQYANKEYTYFDDSVESLKRELKHTKIQISDELKNQITDYGDFVKDSKLMLRRNSGQSVDKVYKEYSDMYPGFFSNDVWNEEEQLEALNDFVNHDFSVTEKYKLTDEDLRNATDLIYNKLLDNSLTQEDLIATEEILDKKVQKRTRAIVDAELLNKMGITADTIQAGNDIAAIAFARTDPIRVNEKVFGWKTGQLINDATVNFTKHQEAERIRFLNKERQEIKDLGIKARSKESELVQKYGEKQYVDKNNEVHKYGDAELARDVQDYATREKIKNAARVLRQKYDTYLDMLNEAITAMGYDEIPKRKDYMRHFVELDDVFSRLGTPFNKEAMSAEDLPTDINGLTEFNKPGRSYFANAKARTGLQTTYDAITGIDGYLEGMSNWIYHTESIQRYRALSRFIRENYGREHGLDNIDLMTDEELAERVKNIQDNKLSKYVAWLDEQANSIAGKKGALDRNVERALGRRVYTALNTLKSQVGSNMTGFNVRSAMTNFASLIQGMSKTQKMGSAEGLVSTVRNIVHDDGLMEKSDFLTSRLLQSESLAVKPWQKLSKAGQVFMEGTDWFTANAIWRGKYYENLHKGMSEQQAIKNADDFAARIMGDRSKGATAELFNSKTWGFLTQFQLEVNNQWSSLIHDNKIDIQKGNKTPLGVTFELGQLFAASYMFNTMMKSLTGSDVMIDPIDMMKKIFFPDDDDKDKGIVERAQEVLGEFINQLPFASMFTGGRIPIGEAFKGGTTLVKKLSGGTDNYGNKIDWADVDEDLKDSLAYWVLPTGYGQIRKTTKGLSMYDDKLPIAGSYTKSGNLRFSAEDTTLGKVKAGLFGQYSSKYAQDYIKSGYKSINASKLDEMKDLDMNSTEYRKYRQGLSGAGTSIQDKLDYISSLDVSDEDKTIMASNAAKKDIDMSEYKKYGTYEEFSYAQENPAKYQVMKYLGGYDTYKNYEKAINDIKADYDRNGKAITNSRKNKVIKYVNSLNLSRAQKAMLIKEEYPSFTKYDNEIASYVNKQDISYIDKASILKQLGFTAYDKQIINYIKQNYRTVEEQQRELEKLGFKVYNYNGKTYVR